MSNANTFPRLADAASSLYPSKLWQHFAAICNIPHASGNEAKLVEYVKNFAKKLNLECKVDSVNNLIIKKPATTGMENNKRVILQAHLDMVPSKTSHVAHDFAKDPILAVVDNGWVHATETSLGADNGIGAAAMLTILESTDLKHGPMTALFTIEEETTMKGAFNLTAEDLKGSILLNLDNDIDTQLLIGSAGGQHTSVKLPYEKTPVKANSVAFSIELSGLEGGHSGVDIHRKRGNAHKILNLLLSELTKKYAACLASINGGLADNGIPNEATALITVAAENAQAVQDFTKQFLPVALAMNKDLPEKVKLTIHQVDLPKFVFDKKTQENLLLAICACPSNIIDMHRDIPALVETSNNLGVIKTKDDCIEVYTLQRSANDLMVLETSRTVEAVFRLAGATVEHSVPFVGWEPNLQSAILKIMHKIYVDKFNKEPEITVVHAGLECGIFKGLNPDLDMISFGPLNIGPHSPTERVEIASVGRFWDLLTATLASIP